MVSQLVCIVDKITRHSWKCGKESQVLLAFCIALFLSEQNPQKVFKLPPEQDGNFTICGEVSDHYLLCCSDWWKRVEIFPARPEAKNNSYKKNVAVNTT